MASIDYMCDVGYAAPPVSDTCQHSVTVAHRPSKAIVPVQIRLLALKIHSPGDYWESWDTKTGVSGPAESWVLPSPNRRMFNSSSRRENKIKDRWWNVPNEKNLIPYQFTSDQSREEAAKNGAIGGRASGAARRRKRNLKEAADLFLSLPVTDNKTYNAMAKAGVEPEDIDNQMMIIMGLAKKAAKGDAKAAKVLFELFGDESKDSENIAPVEIVIDV